MLRLIVLIIMILSTCLGAVNTPGDNPYGVGGSGNYADYLGITWFREWDHFHRPVNPNPPNRFWTVGKLDGRVGDCMPGTWSATRENIDAVFDCDVLVITEIIDEGYVSQMWEIGNEPNWHPYVTPANYAYQFHLYHEFIAGLDPSARVMNGGVTLYPGSWSNWLDSFVAIYENDYGAFPPVGVWNCHPYDIFDAQAGSRAIAKIVAFRSWLDNMGFEDEAFWITEFGKGNWQPEPETNIVTYVETVCGWLNGNAEDYGIERWFWWGALSGSGGMGSNGLFSAGPYNRDTVTLAGDAYIAASGRVFVDGLGYSRDHTREVGTMRNPYTSAEEAIRYSQPGMIVYDFRDGTEIIVPFRAYLPLVFDSPLSSRR